MVILPIHRRPHSLVPALAGCILVLALTANVSAAGFEIETGPRGLACADDPIPALVQGTFELFPGTAHLHDGRAQIGDDGKPCVGSECEWSFQLMEVTPFGTSPRFLMVAVNAYHLRGTGAWTSVLVYVCMGRTLVQTFNDRGDYGVTDEVGTNGDFWLTVNVWDPSDAHCCPSKERRDHYVWESKRQRFVVTESATRLRPPR